MVAEEVTEKERDSAMRKMCLGVENFRSRDFYRRLAFHEHDRYASVDGTD